MPLQAFAAGTYGYSEGNNVVGMARYHEVGDDESLYVIAREYNLGLGELWSANPSIIDPRAPGVGNRVLLPTRWILPSWAEGMDGADVVVNLAEMRTYRFGSSGGRSVVSSYPIGVAIEGFYTPLGRFTISEKLVKPWWSVPDSIKKEMPELPDIVPPGEENPLGEYAMKLSDTAYFIHGTNKPYGIGMRVSHGCIRLYPEDIGELFSVLGLGDTVDVVYEPVKAGLRAGGVFIEVHKDYLGRVEDMLALAFAKLEKAGLLSGSDEALVKKAVEEKLGLPVLVGRIMDSAVAGREKCEKNPEDCGPGVKIEQEKL